MAEQSSIIGRKAELETFDRVFSSSKSEFVILYGRRRVGKTFLVNHKLGDHFTFRMTGLSNATLGQQLVNFHTTLVATPITCATKLPSSGKKRARTKLFF